jgi:uncharacterized protein YbbC (DUF1343 family)
MGLVYLLLAFLAPVQAYDYGIDRLVEPEVVSRLEGRRVAVLAHAASVDREGRHLIDLVYPRFKLKKIFVPEHGLRSVNDGWIKDGVDEKTGLPVLSLYQERSRAPKAEDLTDIDVVVMDLQDVGVRYYTYFSTIAEFIKVAAKLNKQILLLDRPNLLGGQVVEGETLSSEFEGNFISYFNVPTRHGMTLGELAKLFVAEKKISAKLEVISVKGWAREPVFANADRPWTPSSPAIVSLDQVFLYALWGSLEHFNLSVGRGQTNESAFRVIGAPWITVAEAEQMAADWNTMGFEGLVFVPHTFKVTRAIYQGMDVNGVRLELTPGFEKLRTDEVTYRLSADLAQRFQARLQFSKYAVNYYGSDWFLNSIQENRPWVQVRDRVDVGIDEFASRKLPHLSGQE